MDLKNQNVCTNTQSHVVGDKDGYPFSKMAALLDSLQQAASRTQQVRNLESFWKTLVHATSFFPFMRLLLPQLDSVRPMYNIKESKLARMYVGILGLSRVNADATRLLHWKDPSKNSVETTNFSDVVFVVLSQKGAYRREDDRSSSCLTVDELNCLLDDLSSATNSNAQKQILTSLTRRCTAVEQRWIIRIILKDLRCGMTHQSILAAFHPNALNLFNRTSDLRYVCDQCLEEMRRPLVGSVDSGIFLFQPLQPMLAGQVTASKLSTLLREETVLCEPKYDGERIMIHVSSDSIMYWTRNAKNYTDMYGPKFDDVIKRAFKLRTEAPGRTRDGTSSVLHDSWQCKNAIFDGEFLLFDGISKNFVPFGMNRAFATGNAALVLSAMERGNQEALSTASEAVHSSLAPTLTSVGDGSGGNSLASSQGSLWYCYMVFDILFLDGVSLLARPLAERKKLFQLVLSPETHRIELVATTKVRTVTDILDSLERALLERHEGVVLKIGRSPYIPAERKDKWMKLKPDHISGLADTLDLVVLGGYYGTKFGTRQISHFLLGVWVNGTGSAASGNENENGNEAQGSSCGNPVGVGAKFHTVCKVGTGYNNEELRVIQHIIDSHWESPPNRTAVPEWLDGWKPSSADYPDVYVRPRHSVVLEVYGYSFVESTAFRAGFTVRFPRFLRIRKDKSVVDATDLLTLTSIRDAASDPIRQVRSNNTAGETLTLISANKRKREHDGLAFKVDPGSAKGNSLKVDVSEALSNSTLPVIHEILGVRLDSKVEKVEDDLFAGYEICILESIPGGSLDRSALERLLLSHSARLVENPLPSTSIILAAHGQSTRVKNWIAAFSSESHKMGSKYLATSLVHVEWVQECVAAQSILPLNPRRMLYTSPRLASKFKHVLDEFEDSYYDPCDTASFQRSVEIAKSSCNKYGRGDDRASAKDSHTLLFSFETTLLDKYEILQEYGLLPPTARRYILVSAHPQQEMGQTTQESTSHGRDPENENNILLNLSKQCFDSLPLSNFVSAKQNSPQAIEGPNHVTIGIKKEDVHSEGGPIQLRRVSREDAAILPCVESSCDLTCSQILFVCKQVASDGSCVVRQLDRATHLLDEEAHVWEITPESNV